ncbi:MAG: choice-of-anchor B family protein [Bacteroidota bacterium]
MKRDLFAIKKLNMMNTNCLYQAVCLCIALCYTWTATAQIPCTGGMAGSYPCSNADLQSFIPLTAIQATSTNDIWGWTDPMDGKEYAIVCLSDGTAFVDITDPVNPIFVGKLPTHSSSSNWRDVKVYNNHAFIVSEASGHGMQSFDLTRLRTATPPTTFTEDGHVTFGNGNAHNIVANEETGYMYTVGTRSLASGGLVFIDVSAPKKPVIVGSFASDGYTHDAVCFNYRGPDTEHICKEICIGFNEDTYTIVDVTDKKDPQQISRNGYGNSRYTHQGWITDDHRYLIVDDELDESRNNHNTRSHIFDITDLDNPVSLGYHEHPQAAIDHNMYIKGRYVFQSNYTAGVRILDIADVANGNLTEVAYFDVYPADDDARFSGTWSNYPYFRSGNVIATNRTEGFMVFKPTFPHYTMTLESPSVLELCPGETKTFEIDVTAYAGFSEVVNFSVANVPADLNVVQSAGGFTPNNSLTITVTADANATDAAYSLLLEGIGNDASSAQNMALGVKVQSGITLAAKVLLQGAFDNGGSMMEDILRSSSLLPMREPYTLPSATNTVLQNAYALTKNGLFNGTGNNAIVDWVTVELRDENTPEMILVSRAALLQRDGDIVDIDGFSAVKFPGFMPGNYHVAIRHRNHLGVMSNSPVNFSTSM